MEDFIRHIEEAAIDNNLDAVKQLIQKGSDQSILNAGLTSAVAYGHIELADFFIEKGADLTCNNFDPLYWACHNQNESAIKYVLSKGVDINVQDGLILWMSSISMDYEFIKWLLENGADINLRGGDAFIRASEWGTFEVVKLLLGYKPTIESLRQAKFVAERRRRKEILQMLNEYCP
ncbi:MAG: ankyrin repeat domain-containing protein [Saprospiraceae bacterium]